MHILVLLIFAALVFLPQWWVKRTLRRYSDDIERIPGTGSELARHLLDRFELQHVDVEPTQEGGDHYDPVTRTVRLSESYMNGHSLTAVAVATHEVGHAIQHAQGHRLLLLRGQLIHWSRGAQVMANYGFVLAPLAAVVSRSPSIGFILLAFSVLTFISSILIHLVTLPVELDASFGKALPILREGYIEPADQASVERILKAAALTYVASSAASLLNAWRWLKIMRH